MLSTHRIPKVNLSNSTAAFQLPWSIHGRARQVLTNLPGRNYELQKDATPDLSEIRFNSEPDRVNAETDIRRLISDLVSISTPLGVVLTHKIRPFALTDISEHIRFESASNDEIIQNLWSIIQAPRITSEQISDKTINPVPNNPLSENSQNTEPLNLGVEITERDIPYLAEYNRKNGERRRFREILPEMYRLGIQSFLMTPTPFRITIFSANSNGLRDSDVETRLHTVQVLRNEVESIARKYAWAQYVRKKEFGSIKHNKSAFLEDSYDVEEAIPNMRIIVNALCSENKYGINDNSSRVRLESLSTLDLITKFTVFQLELMEREKLAHQVMDNCYDLLVSVYLNNNKLNPDSFLDGLLFNQISELNSSIETFTLENLTKIRDMKKRIN